MYVVYVPCSIAMLFICTLVRSHPVSNEGAKCETDPLEQTARCWVGQSNQGIYRVGHSIVDYFLRTRRRRCERKY